MKQITPSACRRMIRSMPITRSLANGFAANGWTAHLPAAYERAAAMFADYSGAGKALMMHMKQLLPMIAMYEQAVRITGSREAALDFMEKWAFREAEKMMKIVRPVMKLGLYRLMPSLCGLLLDRMFGRAAGFDYRPVPDAPRFAVDMTRCPYAEACEKYGCPELTQYSCRADDVTYGSLHPRLVWARTQTLGTGGECCDFRLHLKEK